MPAAPPRPRLQLARKLCGLSRAELGRRVNRTGQAITQYEEGVRRPDQETLRALARELQTSAQFLLAEHDEPLIDRGQCNYRSLARTKAGTRRRAEATADLFHLVIQIVADLLGIPLPDPQLPRALGDVNDDLDEAGVDSMVVNLRPEHVATTVRREWGLGDGPIEHVVDLLEHHGILVHVLHDTDAQTIDAFSVWASPPLLLLNHAKEDPFRSRMDAAHELGHLVMHPAVVTQARTGRTPNQEIERQAKEFAGAFLVPGHVWREEAPRSTNPWAYLDASERWGVSVAALIVRSHRAGVLNKHQYQTAMKRYNQVGWKRIEGRPPDATHERPTFLAEALEELQCRGMSRSDIAAMIGAGPHLDRLLGRVERSGTVVSFPGRRR
ncbi:MAG: ImmA/IrrE family metallo-endopeptidase [Deltaproteobacteria bacterium]|nr:ImmA/IrrE family metallo-endopeptidase [Deltaproteobacteria bacterium]